MITLRDAGSSTSGTPGTKVAEITAGSGKKLVHWYLAASQGSGTDTQIRIIITYTDDTTTTIDSSASTTSHYFGNAAAIVRRNASSFNNIFTLSAKDVKNIRVQTLGTGTTRRDAALSATEVDATDTKRSVGSSTSGTAGTVVASITADSGKSLVGWHAIANSLTTANSNLRLTVTYSDTTTTTHDTIAGSDNILLANAGGCVTATSGINASTPFFDKEVTQIEITTLGTGTGTRRGVISAEQAPLQRRLIRRASGSSTSTTAGTLVAEVEAEQGWLYAPTIFVGHLSTTNSAVRTIVTYTDDTTSTSDTATSNAINHGNAGGMVRIAGAVVNQTTSFDNTGKRIKKIRVQTLSTGSGTRFAAISALEQAPPTVTLHSAT
jgi:hypothetical protein